MTKVGFLLLAISALSIGCKKGGGSGGDDCATAVDKVVTLAMPEEIKQMPPDKQTKVVAKFRGAFEASCKEDGWPADGKKCIAAAKTKDDLDKCEKSMESVEEKIEKRVEAVQKEVQAEEGGGGAPPPTDPAAGGGSAPTPPPSGGGGAAGGGDGDVAKFIADYEALRDKLCACTDKACAEKAKADADAHERSAKDKGLRPPTPEENKKFEAVENQINECARKF
jgi:hypothetical protein